METNTELKQIQINKCIREQAEQFELENRMLQCTEEAGELIQALSKYRRIKQGDKTCRTDMCHAEYMVAEEMADLEICIEQLKCLLGNTEQIEQIKAERYIEQNNVYMENRIHIVYQKYIQNNRTKHTNENREITKNIERSIKQWVKQQIKKM